MFFYLTKTIVETISITDDDLKDRKLLHLIDKLNKGLSENVIVVLLLPIAEK